MKIEQTDVDQCYASSSLTGLVEWITVNGPVGHDPYDALASPFLARIAQGMPLVGQLAIGALRLSPLNLRALLGIRPTFDAKALGLIARAYFSMSEQVDGSDYWRSAAECLGLLEEVVIPGFGGACWAHPFPYVSSRGHVPADFPSVVSTVYAAQAFLDGYDRGKKEHWLEIAHSACVFILKDLARIGSSDCFCFSYHPGVKLPVHNANLLAAVLLARVARSTGEEMLMEPALASLRYTLNDQQPDGSWLYDGPGSDLRANSFVDGFHTGFVLESLWDISQDAGIDLHGPITRGLEFYLNHLFERSGQPLRFVGRFWPLDLRDCAQAIIVLSRLRQIDHAAEEMLGLVLAWTLRNMQASLGHFYSLRWKRFVTPIPYIRFQAWMLVALARYFEAHCQNGLAVNAVIDRSSSRGVIGQA